jgi:mRNA interferase HigB
MRIISVRTLKDFWLEFPQAEQALLSWYEETEAASWNNPNELKSHYHTASVLN